MQYMQRINQIVKRILGVIVCVCSIASSATGVPSLGEGAPHLNLGDKWQYKKYELLGNKVSIQTQQVTEAAEDGLYWIFIENLTNGNKNWWLFDEIKNAAVKQYYFNASSVNLRGRLRTEKTDPVRIQFPLNVGKKYQLVESWNNETGDGITEYSVEVIGVERVQTEAGIFDAWKLQLIGKWILTKDPSQNGLTKGQLWYSPQVKRIVKQVFSGYQDGRMKNQITFELQKWSPGGVN